MRHHNKNRKLGRKRDARRALLQSLARALVTRNHIRTTEARAKELRPFIEKLITLARLSNLSARRLVAARLGGDGREARKLCVKLAPNYKDRSGGYTRVLKLPRRLSDGARMAIIEFV
ncbi:50S ribosomal protein L17 [Candidatus Nomurabacteria bacterium RIFCSPLOWO2_02_FULL_42_17]|uniref:Large ribosomal subunit protein bL17 n=2 Tax=Candidatus Nomuraibacteriota TaxID=1752729 RepID=A0A1F6WHY4_9BACT|nr:MAG: 50S ribosomal protein L17 [Parcubacteria group bacterium GW2011_GWA2_42_18]OGI81511.1 MAG: 50S ribosomal protein L17 [Candidatus Nomurabacteria bacterium RIFCSPHIGHO2_02_FULL_42_24]OGI96898.1 MAG: 50S ribosomal protein L17 [Candidatus Nomurabacteria bacterium RIFCSPLOWO2_02_FULL_42_17]